MKNFSKIKFNPQQKKILEELGVSLVYVFGSQVDGTANILSDIDLGVVFAQEVNYRADKKERYVKLFDLFTDIFSDYRKVDLIFLQETPLTLQYRAACSGQVIYRQDPSRRQEFDYKEYVMKRHADTEYFRKQRYQAILERID